MALVIRVYFSRIPVWVFPSLGSSLGHASLAIAMIISHSSTAGGPPSPCPSIYKCLQPQEPTKMVAPVSRSPATSGLRLRLDATRSCTRRSSKLVAQPLTPVSPIPVLVAGGGPVSPFWPPEAAPFPRFWSGCRRRPRFRVLAARGGPVSPFLVCPGEDPRSPDHYQPIPGDSSTTPTNKIKTNVRTPTH